MLFIRTVLFMIIVPIAAALVIPYLLVVRYPILMFDLGASRFGGLLLIAIAWVVCIWCMLDFYRARGTPAPNDPPKELVVRGLYRFTRNPMYIGALSSISGMAIFFGSGLLLLYALGVFIVFHLVVTLYEEPHLRRVFGAAYEEYCKRVPRWLPAGGSPDD